MNDTVSTETTRAPLIAHLLEFRRRFIIALIALLAGFAVSYLYVQEIYQFLVRPLAESYVDPEQKRLIYTSLVEAFFTYVRLSFFAGFFLAFPVIAGQLYLFLAPGLYKQEKHVLLPYIIVSPLLFLAGAALAYYYVFPMAWSFFVSFESIGVPQGLRIELDAKVSEYLTLVMQLLIAFGLAFQLPVVLTMLVRVGLVASTTLARGRKYALLCIVIAAAILTPPDVISQIALSIPLYLLYELSILSCRMIEKRQEGEITL